MWHKICGNVAIICPIDEFQFTLGILNIADREPDFVGSNIGATAFNTGNVYPSTYDPLGRRYSLTLRYSL